MEISYELKLNDLEAWDVQRKKVMRASRKASWRAIAIGIIFGLVFVHVFPSLDKLPGGNFVGWLWQLAVVLFLVSSLSLPRWRRTAAAKRWREQFTGNMSLVLTPAGIASTAPGGRMAFRAWPEFVAFSGDESYFYLYLRSDMAIVVPLASLGEQAEAFAERFHALWAAHPENAGKTLPQDPPVTGARRYKEFLANLWGGARIAFMMDFTPARFSFSSYLAYRLFFVQIAFFGLADYLDALPNPAFSIIGVPAYATIILLTIMSATICSGLVLRRDTTARLLVMVAAASLAISIVVIPLHFALKYALPHVHLAYQLPRILYVAWALLAVGRISVKFYNQPWVGALSFAAVFAFFVFALGSLVAAPQLFYYDGPDTDPYYRQAERLDMEDVYYNQPALIQKALASFTPRKPGKENLYYVGFAGDGRERVFTNEVNYVHGLLDRRFGTAGHSLIMDNNLADMQDTPLANRHNLDAVFKGVAARMDKKYDVLFLFLSSHGGQDHRLSVSHYPLGLNDLKAEDVKTMLDRYGIKNRVIVVSACYSGGFLDVLKDDNSLIITASSRDHVAYGCGDYTQYTYFGEAYFTKALAHENSFVDAYDDARKQIAARENKEGESHSRPQIYVGKNIQAVLRGLAVAPVNAPMPKEKVRVSLAGPSVLR